MKNFSIIFIAFILMLNGAYSAESPEQKTTNTQIETSFISKMLNKASLSKSESDARNASVRVASPDGSGYGSGTYGYYQKEFVVFTAHHVVEGFPFMIVHGRDGEQMAGVVIYTDPVNDFAVLKVGEMTSRDAMKFKPADDDVPDYIGWDITYTGFPSGYDLLTITGKIAGIRTDGQAVVAHSFTWMGASGSGVFNDKGEYVGVLVAVGLGHFQVTQIVEDMVWIIPSTVLDWKEINKAIKRFN
jgi:S1-C subfamily serine protease